MDEQLEQIRFLKRLRDEVDHILDNTDPSDIDGAINWADLGCVEASYVLNQEGHTYYSVLIEEADPHNTELQMHIHNEIGKLMDITVEVRTEW